MAEFILQIPDEAAGRIAYAVCRADGYGPADFASAVEHTKEHVFRYLARMVIEQEANAAAVAAADEIRGNADDPLAAALFTPVVPQPEPVIPGPVGPTGPGGETGPVAPTGATAFGEPARTRRGA